MTERKPRDATPFDPAGIEAAMCRSASELREDLSWLYAELYCTSDPRRCEEIALEIYQLTGEFPRLDR